MAKQKTPVRPYFRVKHEYDASLKAYQDAASMLNTMVRSAVSLATTPEAAMRLIAQLKTYSDQFEQAAYGDD